MRIAQVAPLYESVPPKLYGGTERVVAYLTDELVRQGHEVTLFASGDSVTRARQIAPCGRSLRLDRRCIDQLSYHMVLLDQVFELADEFDIIHFHIDYLHYPLSRWCRVPHITTLHGRLDLPELLHLYRRFREVPVVSISDAQRRPLPWINWQGTVYHGLNEDGLKFHSRAGNYLAFLGRVSPEKRLDQAIEIARRSGVELKIAAKVDKVDRDYFEQVIRPLLSEPGIEFIGEIDERAKDDFLGNARALLFPIDWPEPFGLVMIESLACGTPVIARSCGSVPEIITNGVTGYICDALDEAVAAVHRIDELSRDVCRNVFQTRFSSERMAKDYVRIYQKVIRQSELTEVVDDGRSYSSPRPILHPRDIVTS